MRIFELIPKTSNSGQATYHHYPSEEDDEVDVVLHIQTIFPVLLHTLIHSYDVVNDKRFLIALAINIYKKVKQC